MELARNIAKRASRRLLARDLLRRLGPWLTGGAAVGLAAVIVDRLVGPGVAWWLLLGAPVAVALAASVALAWRARLDTVRAAVEVDSVLRLRDRLSSGIELSGLNGSTAEDAFAVYAVQEAETRAAGVRVRDVAPLRLDSWWWAWPTLGALAVLAAMLLPTMRLLSPDARMLEERRAQEVAERDRAAEQIDESRAAIERTLESLGGASDEQIRALEDLTKELQEGRLSAEEARATAAAALEDMAEREAMEARRIAEELESLRDRFAPRDGAQGEEPSALEDALRRGDFASAAEMLRGLEQSLTEEGGAPPMTTDQRERMARDLERLAERLQQSEADAAAEQRQRDAEESLRDLGLSDEEAARLTQERDEQSLREQLEQRGIDPEVAERLARRLSEENRKRDAAAQAERDAQELSEALREAARDVRESEQNGRDERAPDQPDQADQDPASSERPDEGERDEQGERGEQDEQGERTEGEAERDREDGTRPQGERGPREGEQQQQQQQQQQRQQQQQQEGEPSGSCSGGQCEGVGRAADKLSELSERGERGKGAQQKSDTMRDRARQLARNEQEGERREGGSDPRPGSSFAAGATRSPTERGYSMEDVDARRGGESDRVLAEWLNPAGVASGDPGASRETLEGVRDAAESAERAMEEQAVPSRYRRAIREYFRRLPETVPPSAEDAAEGSR